MKKIITFYLLFHIAGFCFAQEDATPIQFNNNSKLVMPVGQLGKKLGTLLTVQGIITEGYDKKDKGDPYLVVQMINDSLSQHFVQIPLSPYFGEFGNKPLPKLKKGVTYIFRGYETGEFSGIPPEAYKESGIHLQTIGFYFQNTFIVISAEKTNRIEWSPIGLLEQYALLQGVAKNENDTPIIYSSDWKLKITGCRKWTHAEAGKPAEVYGKIKATNINGEYVAENSKPRLVKLTDQVGKTVKLRGKAINVNGYWWFNYRGTDIYVDKMEDLPGWNVDNHYRPIEVTGILEQEKLPDINQITAKTNPDLKLYFIVRNASWAPIDELLTPELRF